MATIILENNEKMDLHTFLKEKTKQSNYEDVVACIGDEMIVQDNALFVLASNIDSALTKDLTYFKHELGSRNINTLAKALETSPEELVKLYGPHCWDNYEKYGNAIVEAEKVDTIKKLLFGNNNYNDWFHYGNGTQSRVMIDSHDYYLFA